MKNNIREIFKCFEPCKNNFQVTPITSGHINVTYLILNGSKKYILQELNTSVFPNLEVITENIEYIARHLISKKFPYMVLEPLAFKDGKYLHDYRFRLFKYIENSQTFVKVQSPAQAYQAAKCLGAFHASLNDIVSSQIKNSIEGFLDFPSRLQQFQLAVKSADNKRLVKAKKWIEGVFSKTDILSDWEQLLPNIPCRILHADPKISNFLFSEGNEEEVVSLIDWDTLIKGPILYDFGDMVRSYTNLKEEDDPTQGDNFSYENFVALQEGFLFHLNLILTPEEKSNLVLGAETVIYIQTIRFLTDYLNGDKYYSIEHEHHNLDRAKSQWNLLIALQERLK